MNKIMKLIALSAAILMFATPVSAGSKLDEYTSKITKLGAKAQKAKGKKKQKYAEQIAALKKELAAEAEIYLKKYESILKELKQKAQAAKGKTKAKYDKKIQQCEQIIAKLKSYCPAAPVKK